MDTRDTLLLACGSSASRESLRSVFENDFNLLEADNSRQAMMFLEQNHSCIAMIILDTTMPEKIHKTVLRNIEKTAKAKEIPVVIISNISLSDAVVNIFEQGVTDVYPPDVDPYVLQQRIHNIVELYRHKWHLQKLVDEQAATLRHSNDAMVDALSSIIEYRSLESGQHILRIRRFTQILLEEIARSCPEYGLNDETIRIISSAAALHDVGKISIPDSILNKPGKLTPEEWEIMKSHASVGHSILRSLGDVVNQEYLRYAYNIAHYHHERWDGNGYPEGLVGDEIPICAQAVGLADAYDALTSMRVYKDAFPFEQAVNMIVNGECGVFSPKLLECFKQVSHTFETLAQSYADGQSPKNENYDVTLPPPAQNTASNTLSAVQAKYRSILHYVNAAAAEVDVDQGLYHLIYNPDPNLISLRSNHSVPSSKNSWKRITESIIIPDERVTFRSLLDNDIPRFFKDGLHRMTHRFHVVSRISGQPEPYDVTFLRLDPSDFAHQRMIILWRKADSAAAPAVPSAESSFDMLMEPCCFRNDTHLTLIRGQQTLSRLLGYSTDELADRFQNRLIEMLEPQHRSVIRQDLQDQLENSSQIELMYSLRHKNGKAVWLIHKAQLTLQDDGSECLYSILVDITPFNTSQKNYSLTLDQYREILARTGNILFELDFASDTATFSNIWNEVFGYAPLQENFIARLSTESHFHPDDISRIRELFQLLQENPADVQLTEARIAKADGRYLWCRIRAAANVDENGNPDRVLGIIVNIDAEKQATQALRRQAEQDALTKLFNKEAARRRVEAYLADNPEGAHCALFIIDLDNFKHINDHYGHMFGDSVLTQVAKEIKKLFRVQDVVARIGGDEFMVLMQDVHDLDLVKSRCERMMSAFFNIFLGQMYDSPLGCSVGVSFSPIHGTSYSELFQHADQALYQAKALGKNRYVFYDNKDPVYHTPRQIASTRIDSEEQPGLSTNNIVHHAFYRLHRAKDTEAAVNEILELMGRQTNVSRVYVFENTPDNRFCSNTFEWCNTGIVPQKELLQNISYETDIPNYEANFDEHGLFYVPDVSELPPHLREILEPQGIKSLLHCAIRDNGVFRGYIGFDDCFTNRFWTKDQIETLTFFSDMLSGYLLKVRAQEETARRADDLASVLDNQKAWVYVIDPDTCSLRFLNARTRAIAPNAEEGMFCYKALMGLDSRCPGCPAENIREAKNHERTIINNHLHLRVQSEATLIRWGGEEACLLSCREAPPDHTT